jgi:hypothetical protein
MKNAESAYTEQDAVEYELAILGDQINSKSHCAILLGARGGYDY